MTIVLLGSHSMKQWMNSLSPKSTIHPLPPGGAEIVEVKVTFWQQLVEVKVTFWQQLVEVKVTFWQQLVEVKVTFWQQRQGE